MGLRMNLWRYGYRRARQGALSILGYIGELVVGSSFLKIPGSFGGPSLSNAPITRAYCWDPRKTRQDIERIPFIHMHMNCLPIFCYGMGRVFSSAGRPAGLGCQPEPANPKRPILISRY